LRHADNDLVAASPDEARVAATAAYGMTTVADDTITLTADITALAPHIITEVGVFDAAIGGNLLYYCDDRSINLGIGQTIFFTVNLSFS
jgi:hypothetical protein